MQVSLQLSTKPLPAPEFKATKISILKEWQTWFAARQPSAVAYVQDMVHISVKLKSRLMKLSVVLSMGLCVAGAHHLCLIQKTFGKDEHGLRERDLNHKDKQNYEAVIHICSQSVLKLLQKIPDGEGTCAYIELIRCISDAFLDKQLDILSRIEKAWYAVFFLPLLAAMALTQ